MRNVLVNVKVQGAVWNPQETPSLSEGASDYWCWVLRQDHLSSFMNSMFNEP